MRLANTPINLPATNVLINRPGLLSLPQILSVSRNFWTCDSAVSTYIEAARQIDIDNLNETISWDFIPNSDGTIVSQNISSNSSLKEFQIYYYYSSNKSIYLVLGGHTITICSMPESNRLTSCLLTLSGGFFTFTATDGSNASGTYTVGTARESDATLKIGARGADSNSTVAFAYSGILANVNLGEGKPYYKLNEQFGTGNLIFADSNGVDTVGAQGYNFDSESPELYTLSSDGTYWEDGNGNQIPIAGT